jgi:hypothetical protein
MWPLYLGLHPILGCLFCWVLFPSFGHQVN